MALFQRYSENGFFKNYVTQTSIAHLPKEKFLEVPLPIPLPDEQKAIAGALSDVDGLIAGLEALIAKKRGLKTATMQQLLTGKTRLPGFGIGVRMKQTELGEIPEDWELRTYGNTFKFLPTVSNSRADLSSDQGILYLHYGDIHTRLHGAVDVKNAGLPKILKSKVKTTVRVLNGDIVMADASEDYEGIGKSIEIHNLNSLEMVAGLHTFLLRDLDEKYSDGFRGYLHCIRSVKDQFDRLATGMKVFGLSKTALHQVVIPCPPKVEQRAIVEILSDMENAILTTKQQLSKAKALKQGMMQELLTGRTRLI